jgi:Kef-type K+ transport system membrane component KefB
VNSAAAATLILIAVAAFGLPLGARRIGVPAPVLEILFGIAIGPVFHFVTLTDFISQLGELGFFLLMFLSGFEINLAGFGRRGRTQLLAGLAVFGITLAASAGSVWLLGYGLFTMFVLATTSVGMVVPTLRTTRHMGTALGQAVLVSALIADFLTLIAVTCLALVTDSGTWVSLLAVPAFFGVIAAGLLAVRRLAWWWPEPFRRLFEADDPEELGIRATLALMLVLVGLALVLGIEPILGAFMAGTVFAVVFRHRGTLDQKLAGFAYGFLIPVFFIGVGIRFDLSALGDPMALRITLALIVLALLVKIIAALPLRLLGLSMRAVLAAGLLLSARLSLIIAVAELGVRLGVIDRQLQSSIVLLAAASSTLGPMLFRLVAPPAPAPAGAAAAAGAVPAGSARATNG